MDKKLQEEYLEKMKLCVDDMDTELAHGNADDILCEVLLKLGYADLIEKYKEVHKWYA